MSEWISANGWFGGYMIYASMISLIVIISSANGGGLLGFYKKEASLFGKAIIILFLIVLLPATIYVVLVAGLCVGFFRLITK